MQAWTCNAGGPRSTRSAHTGAHRWTRCSTRTRSTGKSERLLSSCKPAGKRGRRRRMQPGAGRGEKRRKSKDRAGAKAGIHGNRGDEGTIRRGRVRAIGGRGWGARMAAPASRQHKIKRKDRRRRSARKCLAAAFDRNVPAVALSPRPSASRRRKPESLHTVGLQGASEARACQTFQHRVQD